VWRPTTRDIHPEWTVSGSQPARSAWLLQRSQKTLALGLQASCRPHFRPEKEGFRPSRLFEVWPTLSLQRPGKTAPLPGGPNSSLSIKSSGNGRAVSPPRKVLGSSGRCCCGSQCRPPAPWPVSHFPPINQHAGPFGGGHPKRAAAASAFMGKRPTSPMICSREPSVLLETLTSSNSSLALLQRVFFTNHRGLSSNRQRLFPGNRTPPKLGGLSPRSQWWP